MNCSTRERRHFYRPSLLTSEHSSLGGHPVQLPTTSGIGRVASDGRLEARALSSYAENNFFCFGSGLRADRESTLDDPIYYDNPVLTMNGRHDFSRLKNTLNSPACSYIFSGGIGINRSISEPTLMSNQYGTHSDSSNEHHLGVAGRHRPSNQTLRSYCDRVQAQAYMEATLLETSSGVIHRRVITNAKNALLASHLERTRNPVRGGYGHESRRN